MKTNRFIVLLSIALMMGYTTVDAQRTSGNDRGQSRTSESARTAPRSGNHTRTSPTPGGGSSSMRQAPSSNGRGQGSNVRPSTPQRPQQGPANVQRQGNNPPRRENAPQAQRQQPQRPQQPQRQGTNPPRREVAPQPQKGHSAPQANRPQHGVQKPGMRPGNPQPRKNEVRPPMRQPEGKARPASMRRPAVAPHRHPAYNFGKPRVVGGHRYFEKMPPHARHFDHPKGRFYVYGGSFYKWHPKYGYEPIVRPIGLHFSLLPFACVKVFVNSTPYWYGDGVWFSRQGAGYAVCSRPVPANTEVFFTNIPNNCQKVVIDGTLYYANGNDLFVPTNGGYILIDCDDIDDATSVSTSDDGTFVSELPSGSKRVVVNNKLYWYGGDTWFEPISGGYIIVDEPYK